MLVCSVRLKCRTVVSLRLPRTATYALRSAARYRPMLVAHGHVRFRIPRARVASVAERTTAECPPGCRMVRDRMFRAQRRGSTSAAASVASLRHGPRQQMSRADTRLPRTGQTSRVRETTARRFPGHRLPTRRTIAGMAMVPTTGLSRATVQMARTTGPATAVTTARLRATRVQVRAITVRLRAIAVRKPTMVAEVIAVRLRATAVQLRAMAADRTAGRHRVTTVDLQAARCLHTGAVRTVAQLRPMVEAEVARWVRTEAEAEVERHPMAGAAVAGVPAVVVAADTPQFPAAAEVTDAAKLSTANFETRASYAVRSRAAFLS